VLLMSLPLIALTAGPSPARRTLLVRRVRLLVAATIAYNLVEAAVALTAGTLASSTALIGFGLDSVIEVSSAAAVAWQFSGVDHQRRERATLRIIAVSFYVLAAYVTVESVRALVGADRAEHSTVGIVLAAVSLAVMPGLSAAQRRTGRELGSASAVADSKQTLLCTYLSGVLLAGLAVHSLFGWWWADPTGRARHRRRRGQGRSRGLARRHLLRTGGHLAPRPRPPRPAGRGMRRRVLHVTAAVTLTTYAAG
jgi:hypothetical protein